MLVLVAVEVNQVPVGVELRVGGMVKEGVLVLVGVWVIGGLPVKVQVAVGETGVGLKVWVEVAVFTEVGELGVKEGLKVTTGVLVGADFGVVGVKVNGLEQPVRNPVRARVKRKMVRK